MSNIEKYNQIFVKTLGVDEGRLNVDFAYKNIEQWDSVAHLSLISELEDTFDVMFESEDILHFESFENGKRILRKYGVKI